MTESEEWPQWEFGKLLQEGREKLDLNKNQAARHVGLSPSYWRVLERGWVNRKGAREAPKPTFETIMQVSSALNMDPQPLIDAARLLPDSPPDSDVREQMHNYVEILPDYALHEVMAYMKGIILGARDSNK